MTDTNPIQTAFEFQRTAVEQTQQATHDVVEAQKALVETFANSVEPVAALQAQTNDMSQQAAHAYLDAVESSLPEDAADFDELHEAVDDGFESVDDVQADAWESFGEVLDESVTAFDEAADNYTDAVDTTFDTFLNAHEQVEESVEDVAENAEDVAENVAAD